MNEEVEDDIEILGKLIAQAESAIDMIRSGPRIYAMPPEEIAVSQKHGAYLFTVGDFVIFKRK